MEQHVATAKDNRLTYYVLRRKGMRNMRLRVNDKGQVVVSCSSRIPLERINAFVIKNADWLISELSKIKSEGVLEERKYQTCEKYLFAGKEYMLVVIEGEREYVGTVGDNLALVVKDKNDFERKRKLVDNWYKNKAKELFAERFEYCVNNYREIFPDNYKLSIRQMKARWGTCIINKKTVVLNFKLVYSDVRYLDYVIMHELCHFYHKNHDASFYGMLARFIPDYKALRKRLTSYYIRYSHL